MHDPIKILIVDDTPFNVELLEQALQELGYRTVCAANGQEALEQIAAEEPDLMLLDIMMPVMDGFQVLARLKQDEQLRDLPIIVISALTDMPSIVRGIELGADDFLPKPFEPAILRARITNSLNKKLVHEQERLLARAMERELEIGREMQAGFLPGQLPHLSGWEFATYFRAARQVAGDFYDVFELRRGTRIGILVGDVSGKGVGAALYMALFRTLLRATLQWDEFGPGSAFAAQPDTRRLSECIRLTNNYVAAMHREASVFATLFAALLDPATGELCYSNQGHMPPLVLDAHGIKADLSFTGIPVGFAPRESIQVRETRIEPGEMLVLYSDGITDAQNAAHQFLDEETLMDRIRSMGAQSASELVENIVTIVTAHIGSAPRFDDMTLVAVRRELGD